MFTKKIISYEDANQFNKLVSDYLSKKKDTEQLYSFFPDLEGYKKLLSNPTLYTNLKRDLLVNSLQTQALLVSNTSKESQSNISLLKNKNTFTVTTGHQLCLFTGPLYFIYKIISTINLSEWLNKKFPDKKFVPVYWMASEDHDFEEVNHAFVYGKKIQWQSDQIGAVGNFKTEGLDSVIKELETVLGDSENSKNLISLFKKSYLEHSNLTDATRFLANELFGSYGLVIVDGNDKALKNEFRDLIKKDVFENLPFKKVNDTLHYLNSKKYPTQVNPREINCFYLNGNTRNRIEKQGETYKVVNTDISFSKTELEKIIDSEPEKISPNVVLRPLYQQHILPNIAYVGGPGEITYWLEYKEMFDALNIQLPVLQPRQFILIVDKNQQQKLAKLGLDLKDAFKNEQDLIQQFLSNHGATVDIEAEKNELNKVFNDLLSKSIEVDKTLESAVKAENQKALNSLSMLEAKLNKALKQRSDTELNQIKNIKSKLFPENLPQERYDNFSMLYTKWGNKFIEEIKKQTEGNDLNYLILLEN